uniref:tRNAHis guanylyltransferase n=1 Tax=Siphoviridae sp. ctCIv11 TaxID=2827806 RepID=A0A8S5S1E4_9CAUD|nr:MAG TPA: tRNAHis guanylyltransferase [Siphoviridae sp. ctCIv11]
MDRSDLAERMKGYEKRNRYYLQRRMPVILRLDMRAGHSFTRGFERPFDEVFIKSMQDTAKYLCKNIQNCKLSYQQSDEITLLLVDYDKLNTDCFFDYRVDKLCSIAASMAKMAFNKYFYDNVFVYNATATVDLSDKKYPFKEVYSKAVDKGAMFDARCFNIPKEEVTNNFYWRQLDASRNSIQMVGQANFSHKELHKKSRNDIQDMLMTQKGINWNNLPTYQKRGSCCIKIEENITENNSVEKMEFGEDRKKTVVNIEHSHWIIDKEIPIFKGEGREYIDRLVFVGEE